MRTPTRRHSFEESLMAAVAVGLPKTSPGWLGGDKFHEFAELPSRGDNSYPGFIELSPFKGLISWYSSHENDDMGKTITAVHLAELDLVR